MHCVCWLVGNDNLEACLRWRDHTDSRRASVRNDGNARRGGDGRERLSSDDEEKF